MTLGIGVLGLGSVSWGLYRQVIRRFVDEDRVLTAVFDPESAAREVASRAIDERRTHDPRTRA